MGYLASVSHHVWLERFSAIAQPLLSRSSTVSKRFLARKRLATYSFYGKMMIFELFLPVFGVFKS